MTFSKLFKIKDTLVNYFDRQSKLVYVVETNNWIVKWVGEHVIGYLNKDELIKGRISLSSIGLSNKIIHFGSINSFLQNGLGKNKNSNKIVFSWFHVVDNDERLKHIDQINREVDMVLTSCETTKTILIKAGLLPEKISVVGLGVDLEDFYVFPLEKKIELKKSMGIMTDRIIIGSFQKDGNGWGEGLEPKLIKGPDIFCDVMERLSKKYPIQVLLTGPSRGYVKNRLNAAGIPFFHKIFDKQNELVNFYNCLDLYLIASRVEGGPESLAESWATGVPLVATRMGMPADLIKEGENGLIREVADVDGLTEACAKLIDDKQLREKVIQQALNDVKALGWEKLAREYYNLVYLKLL